MRSPILSVSLIAGMAVSPFASAADTTPFDLIKTGSQVCKVVGGQTIQPCYISLEGANSDIQVPEAIELIEQVKNYNAMKAAGKFDQKNSTSSFDEIKTVGGALFLAPEDLQMLAKNYSRLSVRMVAINPAGQRATKTADGKPATALPFVASVYWKGKGLAQGTIFFEAEVVIPQNLNGDSGKNEKQQELSPDESARQLNQGLAALFRVQSFSDSTTEARKETMRQVETMLRTMQIKSIYGENTNVDERTKELLTQVVGPSVVGQVVIIPALESMAKAFGEALGKGIAEAFKGGLNPPKP